MVLKEWALKRTGRTSAHLMSSPLRQRNGPSGQIPATDGQTGKCRDVPTRYSDIIKHTDNCQALVQNQYSRTNRIQEVRGEVCSFTFRGALIQKYKGKALFWGMGYLSTLPHQKNQILEWGKKKKRGRETEKGQNEKMKKAYRTFSYRGKREADGKEGSVRTWWNAGGRDGEEDGRGNPWSIASPQDWLHREEAFWYLTVGHFAGMKEQSQLSGLRQIQHLVVWPHLIVILPDYWCKYLSQMSTLMSANGEYLLFS